MTMSNGIQLDPNSDHASQDTPKKSLCSQSSSEYMRAPAALDTASFMSKILFSWVTPIIMKKSLGEQDLNELQRYDQSKYLCNRLQANWKRSLLLKDKAQAKSNSLLFTLAQTFKWSILSSGMIAGTEIGLKIMEALILGEMVRGFQDVGQLVSGFYWAGAMLVVAVFHALLHHNYFFIVIRLSGQVRVALSSIIYNKAMHLPAGSSSPGLVVNLVGNDVSTFESLVIFGHYLWVAAIEIPIHGYLLYHRLNWPALVGLIIIFLMIPLQGFFGVQFHAFRLKMVTWRDSRIRLMSDLLFGMNVVKLNAWKSPCIDIVTKLRTNEVKFLRRAGYMDGLNEASFFIFPMLVFLLTFLSSVVAGMPLEAPAIYSSVALFNILRLTLTMFVPKAVKAATETLVSSQRIAEFLMEKETSRLPNSDTVSQSPYTADKAHPCITMYNATFTWPNFTLSSISCTFQQASLTTIVGPVSSGKSSLLQAILGEMKQARPSAMLVEEHHREMAYAPQTPWILAGSVLDNIVFGGDVDLVWLNRVVDMCCLQTDIGQWEHGLYTHVGDRGIELSGGQRARVGLARAIYAKKRVLVLDDPLSAVDTSVARHLFHTLRFAPELQATARVLVTHQLQFVNESDHVVVMDAGRIVAQGNWDSIVAGQNDSTSGASEWVSMLIAHNKPVSKDAARHSTVQEFEKDVTNEDKKAQLYGEDDAVAAANTAASKEEIVQIGTVKWTSVKKFLMDASPWYMIVSVVVCMCAAQSFAVLSDWHLSYWVSLPASVQLNDIFYLHKYWILILCAVIFGVLRALLVYHVIISASDTTSKTMLERVMDAPLSWFARNPTGRVLNRFTKDLSLIDEQLPSTFYNFIQTAFQALGVFFVIIMVLPYVSAILPVMAFFFYRLRQMYITSSRQIKRIESSSRSPLYSHISVSLDGLSVIRAMRAQTMFTDQFDTLMDANTRAWFAQIGCNRWLSMRLDLAAAVFTGLAAFTAQALVQFYGLSASRAGLVMAYALQLNGMLQWLVRQSVELEIALVSVERVVEYCGLKGETLFGALIPAREWPIVGNVTITNMSLQYPESSVPVLLDWNVNMRAGERIGIVGRSGAGKSSFFSALFRTYEYSGKIEIDGLDISTIEVESLRKRMSIIPQDPFLFKGSLRFNLDPFNASSDADIWQALASVEMKGTVEQLDGKLDALIEEGGSNLSVGQRQLICLARALLKQSRILVCDEATANICMMSDALIQNVLKNSFPETLVLTIAHRLSTVIDYDRVLVLDGGKIVELGHAWDLLQIPNGVFVQMVNDAGRETAQILESQARVSWETKQAKNSQNV